MAALSTEKDSHLRSRPDVVGVNRPRKIAVSVRCACVSVAILNTL